MIGIQDLWRQLQTAVQRFGWEEKLIVGLLALAILIVTAVYVIRRFRGWVQQPNPSLSDHVTDFRRMRDAGQIDESEFHRVINTASRQQSESEGGSLPESTTLPDNPTSPERGS
jgi:hypothetical protein